MRRASPETTDESAFQRWLRRSTEGRSWWVRAPLVPLLAWWTWRHSKDIWYQSVWKGINLAFHEIGHVLFQMITFGSEFWTIAGGTILELAIPVVAGVMLARQRDAFGVGVAVFWLGTALHSVAAYVYDTRSQIFGRVSIGPYAGPDDWTYLLGRWDLIRQDRVIGMGLKEVAVWVMAGGVLWCAYVCWRMSPWGDGSGSDGAGDAGRGSGSGGGRGPARGRFDEAERLRERFGVLLLVLLGIGGCSDPVDPETPAIPPLEWVAVASGFEQPVLATAPKGSDRIYLVELGGRVWILEDGVRRPEPFLDLSSEVAVSPEFGRGLLSLAFHPEGTEVFAYFVTTRPEGGWRSWLARYPVSADGLRVDVDGGETVMRFDQPLGDHNGGHVFFGRDGMLYLTLGDGGSGHEHTRANGQFLSTFFGKILRIDVEERPYRVPPDNPFADRPGMRGEIWAYGFRHPWRAAADPVSGAIVVGDVGEARWEEVNVVLPPGGDNFGWPLMEGRECFARRECDPSQYRMPEIVYGRDEGCSVGAGVVYRGSDVPGLRGHLLYTDYCRAWIRTARLEGGDLVERREWPGLGLPGEHPTSFGEDGDREVLLVTQEGALYRLEPAGP